MSRQKQILAVLGVIFSLAVIYAWWSFPRQQRASERGVEMSSDRPLAGALQEKDEAKEAAGGTDRLRVDLLQRQEEEFPGYVRNIFRYAPVRKPVPKKPKPAPSPPPPPPPEPETAVVEPVEVEAPPARIERALARFTFLGFMQKGSTKTIFLSSGDEIFLVKKGDRFGEGGEFFVTDLTNEALTIRQEDDPRLITVPLIEQAPLVPEFSPGEGAKGLLDLPDAGRSF